MFATIQHHRWSSRNFMSLGLPESCPSRMTSCGRDYQFGSELQSCRRWRPPAANWPVRPHRMTSEFRLLGDLEGVIDLDAEVSHGRLERRMIVFDVQQTGISDDDDYRFQQTWARGVPLCSGC
jgi:hypothetical protein